MLLRSLPLLTLLLLGGGAPLLHAQSQPPRIAELEAALTKDGMDPVALKALGDHHFRLAVGGDKVSVDRGLEAYLSLVQLEPSQAQHLGRVGSLTAMKGRDGALPLARVWYVQRGLESLAKAVEMAPNDPGVRLTRAHTCLALPAQFNQVDTAIQDLRHLDGMMGQAPDRFPKELVLQTRLLLGTSLKRAGRGAEARVALERVVAEGEGTPFAAQAKEQLK